MKRKTKHKGIATIEPVEFDRLLEDFIIRESQDMGELDAPLFYTALENIYQTTSEASTVGHTIDLQARIVNDQLHFVLPPLAFSGIEVTENEIKINNLRLVIHLAAQAIA